MLPHNCFYLDADCAARAMDNLYGYAILEDGIVLGSGGLAEWRRDNPQIAFPAMDGKFACVLRETPGGTPSLPSDQTRAEILRIRTDVTGQEFIYYILEGGFWAVSNSFALLVARASAKRSLSVYPPAAIAFHLKGGVHMGEQLASFNTLVEEVRMLPATSEICVDLGTNHAEILDIPIMDIFRGNGRSYEEIVFDFISQARGVLAALLPMAPSVQCQLSGGYDSRLVLALLMGQDFDVANPRTRFSVQSHAHKELDLRAATLICERYDIPLNSPYPTYRMLSGGEALRVWDLSCLGTYLPFYPVQNLYPRKGMHLRLTGDTATSWDHFHGIGPLNGSPDKVASDIARLLKGRPHVENVVADYFAAFERVGLDRQEPGAMELFYNMFRSRAHCGRHWYRELGQNRLHTPLCTSAMVILDLLASREGSDRRKVYCDVLLATNPDLLRMPFETEEKAFPEELIAASPLAKAGPIQPKAMQVWGAWDVPEPAAELHLPFLETKCEQADFLGAIRARCAAVNRSEVSKFFTGEDLAKVDAEIADPRSLSHGLRKTAHLLSVAAVVEMVGRGAVV